ncbi:hypothetical protein TL16_g06612 [Triparma laevis f. inornata]|uniref:Cyclic nucleotide-binding domain-containing protein n=1 Tax=Triparma laevis f. inornata TaxID=1714386 RepID=A0A9W7AMI2_9STRA|nr:hypothetical protein TL16_g06612 [Triparma laevis f. inornata]
MMNKRKRTSFIAVLGSERKGSILNVEQNQLHTFVEGLSHSDGNVSEWRMPSSSFRWYWETFNFVLYTTNSFLIPSRVVFGSRGSKESVYIQGVAIFIQFVFFIDLILRSGFFAFEEQGIVVAKRAEIFARYAQTWFLWDMFGFFPFYFVAMAAGVDREVAILLLSFQMLKLVRYFDYWRFLEVHLARHQISSNSAVLEIVKVMIIIAILLVVCGCVLIALGCPNHENAFCNFGCTEAQILSGMTNCTDTDSWMEASSLPNDISHNFMHQINSAVYVVAQALYTIGYGDITVSSNQTETVFTTILMLIGSFSFAMTIAVMSSVIANQDILYMEFRQKMEELSDYMHHRAMPDKLQQKLVNHFDYLFNVQFGKLEFEILDQLPKSLRSEVLKLNIPLIQNHPFLKGSADNMFLLEEMTKILLPRTVSPNEDVVPRGAPVSAIYFVRSGKVNVLSPTDDKSTVTSLLNGDHFGTFEFFLGATSTYSYRTATFSDLLLVGRQDFEHMMENPRFDFEARLIDLTVGYINSNLKQVIDNFASFKGPKTGGASPPKRGSTSPGRGLGGQKRSRRWSRTSGSPDSLARSVRGSLSPQNSQLSLSSIEDDMEDGAKHKGLVMAFLEYVQQEIKLMKKVKQLSKNMSKKNKFADMMDEEEESNILGGKAGKVILANGRFREVWDVLCFTCTMWFAIAVPYRLYVVTWEHGSPLTDNFGEAIYMDYLFDVFSITNIILNMRFFAITEINEKGSIINIVDKDAIWEEYALSGRLFMDVVIAMPYDLLGFGFGAWNVCRVPKLMMAFRIPYLITRLKGHLDRHGVHISLDAILAVNLTVATIVFTHWTSCCWGMLEENVGEDQGKFVASVYWSLTTMTTVGFGDITPSTVDGRWYTISMMILGSCFTAGVIANITAMAHKIVISEDNAQHVTTCVEKYMLEKDIPWELRERCQRYFRMLGTLHNENKALTELVPPAFLPAIAKHNYLEVIGESSVFKDCNGNFALMQGIAMMLKEQIVVQGDWVIKDIPTNDQWYHVKEGLVHIKTLKKGELVEVVKSNSKNPKAIKCFGEFSLFFPDRKYFHAHAMANCVLASLKPSAFAQLEPIYTKEFKLMREAVAAMVNVEKDRGPIKVNELRTTRRNSIMEEMKMAAMELGSRGDDDGSKSAFVIGLFRGKVQVGPDDNFQLGWNMFVFGCLVYNMFMIPFRLAFRNKSDLDLSLVMDYVGDFVFLVDMLFRLNSFGYIEGEKIITDKKKIRARYLSGGKALYDVLAILPVEWLTVLLLEDDPEGSKYGGLRLFQIFGGVRVLKMLRVQWMGEHIRCSDFVYHSVTKNVYKNELKVTKLLMTILLASHWLGCFFFFIAYMEESAGKDNWADCKSSIAANNLFGCDGGKDKSTIDKYIRSFYWAATALTTAGYGDVSAGTSYEQAFSIFVLVTGTLLFATVIANLEEIVAQVDVTSTLFQQKVDTVKMFMKMRGTNLVIAEEVGRYYDTLWLKQKGASETAVLSYLPERIRHEVLKHHCGRMLSNAPIFEKFQGAFIDLVLDVLKSDFFLKGDILYEKGECAFELFLITRGAIDLMDGKEKFMTVNQGSLLGEGEFFNHEPRCSAAQAAEYSSGFVLYHDDLFKLLGKDLRHERIFHQQVKECKDRIDTTGKMEKMKQNLKAGGKMAQMMMLNDDIVEKKAFVLLPDDARRRQWDTFLLLCMICNLLCVPLRVAFYGESMTDSDNEVAWMVGGVLLDVVFWIDIGLNFKYFAVINNGLLINEKEEFKELYLWGRFKWDLLASLPCDILVWASGETVVRTIALVRCARFIHLLRLPGLLQSVIDFLEENGVRFTAGVWHCTRMVFFVLLTTHWFACILYYIAVLQGLDDGKSWTSGTILEDEGLNIAEKYTLTLYWSVYTVTLVGYGDVQLKSNVEMIFAVVCMLTGSVLCDAGITAIMSSIVNALDASAGEGAAWAQVIAKYVKNRDIPMMLEQKIFGFFIHMHLTEHDLDEAKVLNSQPRSVKRKLLVDICFDGMKVFPNFKPYKPGFIKSICHKMEPYLALPSEILIVEGEAADKIFLVVRGKIHVLERTGELGELEEPIHEVKITLENGSILGDFKPNAYTYRTAEYSECYVLRLECYISCFSYVTQSNRGRKASKKNLTDDFFNVVEDGMKMYGNGFVSVEKKRRETKIIKVTNKMKGLIRGSKTEGDERNPNLEAGEKRSSGRSRNIGVLGEGGKLWMRGGKARAGGLGLSR